MDAIHLDLSVGEASQLLEGSHKRLAHLLDLQAGFQRNPAGESAFVDDALRDTRRAIEKQRVALYGVADTTADNRERARHDFEEAAAFDAPCGAGEIVEAYRG